MTLNMKTDEPFTANRHLFSSRAKSIRECIRWNNPDFIGMQEFKDFMANQLGPIADEYMFYGAGRMKDARSRHNERCCICWKKNRFDLLEGSTFWLSHTPEEPGSHFLESIYPRIATLVVLKDRETKEIFTLCNTHLDHVLPAARFKQAAVLMEELSKRARGSFVVLTGDFNTTSTSAAVQHILERGRAWKLQDAIPATLGTTMHDFLASSAHHYRPIDHIFLSENVSVEKSEIISSLYMGVYPSDHCPVMAVFDSPQK